MRDFRNRLAVVTGGGTGMGRELARQLVGEACHVALCDVSAGAMAETVGLCADHAKRNGVRVTAHVTDVSEEDQVVRFRDEVRAQHATERINLLFNNAGIGGGGSLFANPRSEWEKTFNVCWGGVYLCTRTFLPMLVKADAGHIVNTSSVNGFWASLGPQVSHTAYAAAKFAVKGFTEALITDLRLHAPHVKCSVVMPGHIGTSIVSNSRKVHFATQNETMCGVELAQVRARLSAGGRDLTQVSDAELQARLDQRARKFLEEAPMTAAEAAKVILDGVKAERWRILVGSDARHLDEMVRAAPEAAYETGFYETFVTEAGWRLGH